MGILSLPHDSSFIDGMHLCSSNTFNVQEKIKYDISLYPVWSNVFHFKLKLVVFRAEILPKFKVTIFTLH